MSVMHLRLLICLLFSPSSSFVQWRDSYLQATPLSPNSTPHRPRYLFNKPTFHTYIQNTFFADSRKLTVMWQYLRQYHSPANHHYGVYGMVYTYCERLCQATDVEHHYKSLSHFWISPTNSPLRVLCVLVLAYPCGNLVFSPTFSGLIWGWPSIGWIPRHWNVGAQCCAAGG